MSEVDSEQSRYALFLSPLHIGEGVTRYIFDAMPVLSRFSAPDSQVEQIAYADFPGYIWPLASLAWTAIAAALVVRRYRRSV